MPPKNPPTNNNSPQSPHTAHAAVLIMSSNKKQKTTAQPPLAFRRLVAKPYGQHLGQEYSVLGSFWGKDCEKEDEGKTFKMKVVEVNEERLADAQTKKKGFKVTQSPTYSRMCDGMGREWAMSRCACASCGVCD